MQPRMNVVQLTKTYHLFQYLFLMFCIKAILLLCFTDCLPSSSYPAGRKINKNVNFQLQLTALLELYDCSIKVSRSLLVQKLKSF